MPNKASAAKRARQNARRRIRNRACRSEMRTAIKSAREAIASKDAPKITSELKEAQGMIARAVKRGVVHARKAARLTSRLMKKANLAEAAPKTA